MKKKYTSASDCQVGDNMSNQQKGGSGRVDIERISSAGTTRDIGVDMIGHQRRNQAEGMRPSRTARDAGQHGRPKNMGREGAH